MKFLTILLISSLAFATFTEVRYDTISNQEMRVSETNKKKVLIFLSPTCPCSQKQFDYINSLSKKFNNIEFIGFSSNKYITAEKANEYFKEFKIDFPIFIDQELKYANKFGALKTPHVFLINEKEEVIYQGAITNKRSPENSSKFYLNDILTAVRNNQALPYKTSKALGCYIAR